jgi:hypothetical protein
MSRNTTKISQRVPAIAIPRFNVTAWAQKKGYSRTTVHQAIHGTRNGKVTQKIRNELESIHA